MTWMSVPIAQVGIFNQKYANRNNAQIPNKQTFSYFTRGKQQKGSKIYFTFTKRNVNQLPRRMNCVCQRLKMTKKTVYIQPESSHCVTNYAQEIKIFEFEQCNQIIKQISKPRTIISFHSNIISRIQVKVILKASLKQEVMFGWNHLQ